MSFKAGDVVRYGDHGEAIVEDEVGDRLRLRAWRSAGNSMMSSGEWISTGQGEIVTSTARPHRNPDPVLASYVAWRLTQ